jgi:RNA polymerase sigma-70 factor (ECF subfamily)
MLLVEKRELLERFRAGERAALEEVYRHHAPEVAAFLSRGFGFNSRGRAMRFAGYHQPFDLDNAMQETFVRAFKPSARLGYDGLHPYKGYLCGIARNYVLDELRAREVAMSPFVLDVGGATDAQPALAAMGDEGARTDATPTAAGGKQSGSAEHDYLRQELGRLYGEFVAGLDERERGFFHARFEEQRTQVEAGAAVELSHMQARTLEKKLRERFLKFMHRHGYLDGYRLDLKKVPALLFLMVC